jgi:hypothetical protein
MELIGKYNSNIPPKTHNKQTTHPTHESIFIPRLLPSPQNYRPAETAAPLMESFRLGVPS